MKNILYRIINAVAVTAVAAFAAPFSIQSSAETMYAAALPAASADTLTLDTVAVRTPDDAQEAAWPYCLEARLERLLDSDMFQTSTVGMMVYDLTADSVLFRHNEKQLMRPASTLKMIVAVAALDRLGASHRIATELLYTGETHGRTLQGDIYCRGGFDPAFDNTDMTAFVDSIRRLDIDTIRGDIYADVTMKDTDLLGEGWCWDDDNPTLSPLLINRKDEFTKRLKDRLEKAGICVEGQLLAGRTPRHARRLCTVTRTIGDLLPRMMKQSDNLYAEAVFYNLAAAYSGQRPATARQGRRAVNRIIEKLDYKPSRYYIADGSGLSLYNYVSPELEVAFLRHAFHNDSIYVPLYASMPIAGMDGTLDDRMRHGHARGNVHAKTGTVTGVSALAGYCTASNGHTLCFSIINMGIRHASSGRRFQDRVCEALCRP